MSGVRAYVHRLPACDIHPHRKALYDFRTVAGVWMYGCPQCFVTYGRGLGVGKGQHLVVRRQPGRPDDPEADN